MDDRSDSVADWAIKISTFLMVAPWLEKALGDEGWEFFLTGACWALAAFLFVWGAEIKAVSNPGKRPLIVFLVVAAFAAGGSALFDVVGDKLGFSKADKHRMDVLFAVLGTLFTVWMSWKLTHANGGSPNDATKAAGTPESEIRRSSA